MRKSFFLSVIIIFTIVFYFGITDAQVTPQLPTIGNDIPFRTVRSQFAGKISELKAKEISLKEDAGYICEVPGTSIEIRSQQKVSIGYVIPSGLKSMTKHSPRIGQSIIGKQRNTATINCKKCDEKGENCVHATFSLPIIKTYANSSR